MELEDTNSGLELPGKGVGEGIEPPS